MKVWVELGEKSQVLRIFRNRCEALAVSMQGDIITALVEKADAVGNIRQQVFNRANWRCEHCGASLTYKTGQMHEKLPKGKGGEVSLENCMLLCYNCHQGRPDAEHGARRPQFGKAHHD